MESLEFYKFVGGSKHLAADESTTMEVIFPSLNWNPMCPDESWPLKDRGICVTDLTLIGENCGIFLGHFDNIRGTFG